MANEPDFRDDVTHIIDGVANITLQPAVDCPELISLECSESHLDGTKGSACPAHPGKQDGCVQPGNDAFDAILSGAIPIVFMPDSWHTQLGQDVTLIQVENGVCFDPVHQTINQSPGYAVAPGLHEGSLTAQVVGASQLGLPQLSAAPVMDHSHAFETRGVNAWTDGIPPESIVPSTGYVENGALPFDPHMASMDADSTSNLDSVLGALPPFTNPQFARAMRKVKLNAMRARQGQKRVKLGEQGKQGNLNKPRKRAHVLKPGVLSMIPYGMNEKMVWTQRVCMFTARMRAVLGDRKISVPWGGSILDSVAGVFLTQNVSDTSSSKAFMNIATRFPSKNLPRFGTEWKRTDILHDHDLVKFNPEIEPLALWNARDCSDMVDWTAVHHTDASVLAECIRCRGMHNRLAARIKSFLSRIADEDLEGWWKEKKRKQEEARKEQERREAEEQERLAKTLPGIASRLEALISDLDLCPQFSESEIVVNISQVPITESPRAPASKLNGGATMEIVPSSDDESEHDWTWFFKRPGWSNAENQNVDIEADTEWEEVVCKVGEVQIVLDDSTEEEGTIRESQDKDSTSQEHKPGVLTDIKAVGNPKSSPESQVRSKSECTEATVEVRMGEPQEDGSEVEEEVDCDGEELDSTGVPGHEQQIVVVDKAAEEKKEGPKLEEPSTKLSVDWLHSLPDEEVVEFLTTAVDGLGRKSASCVMLLSMGRKDFPVDVNVARICARLGWIPLETVGSIEELEEYAPEEEVHKYLHKRISHFDFELLYELHYQMITLGKVFCTKRPPRCGFCPMKDCCEYARSGGQRFDPSSVQPPKKRQRKVNPRKPADPKPPTSPRSPAEQINAIPPQTEKGYETPRRSARVEARRATSMEEMGILSAASRVGAENFTTNVDPGDLGKGGGDGASGELPDLEDLAGPVFTPPPSFARTKHRRGASDASVSPGSELREMVGSTQRSTQGKAGHESGGIEEVGALGGEDPMPSTPCKSHAGSTAAPAADNQIGTPFQSSAMKLPEAPSPGTAASSVGGSVKTAGDIEVERIVELVENRSENAASFPGRLDAPGVDVMNSQTSELILGLEEGQLGDSRAARKRYHKISMLIHPDKCANPSAGAAFAMLNEALKVATGDVNSQDDLFADLGMGDYGDDVKQEAESYDRSNELIIHPGPPTQSRTRRVFFAILAEGMLLNPIIQLGYPRRLAEDPNPYFLLPDPRVFPVDSRADDDLMAVNWDILPYLKEGRQDIPFLILMPSRSALKGKFPLNGTFFQVNELFFSSAPAVYIPVATLIESKPKWRPVYFSSSVSHMSQGMTTKEVAQLFHFGRVCVRAVDIESGYPVALPKFLMP